MENLPHQASDDERKSNRKNPSVESVRKLAKDPLSSPELLTYLSRSEDRVTRQNIAGNPNTLTKVLFELGVEFPEVFLDNPVFRLLELEAINILEVLPQKTLESLLSCPRGREQLLERVANYPNQEIRFQSYNALGAPNCSPALLEKLVDSNYDVIRQIVASNPKTPATALTRLASDRETHVRQAVASNSNSPAEVLIRLASDSETQVKEAVIQNQNALIPIPILEKLATDRSTDGSCRLQISLILYRSNSEAVLNCLVSHKFSHVRETVARSENVTIPILTKLATDKQATVRQEVARSSKTPAEILNFLASDSEALVRAAVATNKNATSPILKKLATDREAICREGVARNSKTPKEILNGLAADSIQFIRNAARHTLENLKYQ